MQDSEYRTLDLATKQWATVINVQMHFNDMIQKLRQMAATVILAAFGFSVSIYTGENSQKKLWLGQHSIDWQPALIVVFALLFSIAAYITDWYYYSMLMAAVEEGERLESICGFEAGLTSRISEKVARWRARVSLHVYYVCCWICGVALLVFFVSHYVRSLLGAT